MIAGATAVLKENKGAVDALNVFPVPDGDTGTNMSLTMLSASAEAEKVTDLTIAKVTEAIALGSLMGARGNSGVILSQLFRGLARGLAGREFADAGALAAALQEGVETAYKAVMKPVEGTILTVAREAARGAAASSRHGASLIWAWESACRAAETTLARTPDMLPVLKQAKVVDAGGKGLVFILSGALSVLMNEQPGERTRAPGEVALPEFAITEEMGDIRFRYDTQLLVRARSIDLDGLREELSVSGDSLLVVGSDEVARVHIHTQAPDSVLAICLRYGAISRVTIDDMREQLEELKHAAQQQAEPVENPQEVQELREVGVATVASGKGLIEILKSLGADTVVDGGLTMNPSTEDVLHAVNSVPAKRVLFLPNNGNIFLAAKQAKRFCDKKMYVVPTRSIPQGIAALLTLHPEANMETNLKRMAKAMKQVKTGEITYAVRRSQYNGFVISEGDILGMFDGEIAVIGRRPEEVLNKLLDKMVRREDEVITIFHGNGLDDDAVARATGELGERFPHCEIEIKDGGQPLYYYIIAVE
jgi:hypothetical protein